MPTCSCLHTYMPRYMHAHIHTCLHTYMPTYIHAHIHTCLHACPYSYMPACINAYIPSCMHEDRQTDMRAGRSGGQADQAGQAGRHTYLCTYLDTHMLAWTHAYTNARMLISLHTYDTHLAVADHARQTRLRSTWRAGYISARCTVVCSTRAHMHVRLHIRTRHDNTLL